MGAQKARGAGRYGGQEGGAMTGRIVFRVGGPEGPRVTLRTLPELMTFNAIAALALCALLREFGKEGGER